MQKIRRLPPGGKARVRLRLLRINNKGLGLLVVFLDGVSVNTTPPPSSG